MASDWAHAIDEMLLYVCDECGHRFVSTEIDDQECNRCRSGELMARYTR